MVTHSWLLITDLDHTLVGDDAATQALNQQLLQQRSQVCLIYATGRSYPSAKTLQADRQLLEPDYWITGVGSEIYEQGKLEEPWANQLSQQWHREKIIQVTQTFPDLIPQPTAEQNPWKISFYLQTPHAATILQELEAQLALQKLPAQIIYSSNRDLDLLPLQAHKGLAMAYLIDKLQIDRDRGIACGDSGNDIGLLMQSTYGVVVNNALPELLSWYQTQNSDRYHLASQPYAWGMIEGLEKFGFLPSGL
ncbi:MAG: sucrose-phosphate phosphatase [Synechococcales bacterium]|nr:sucrose-phosphate phosphatase [Synechococcales bacterium]